MGPADARERAGWGLQGVLATAMAVGPVAVFAVSALGPAITADLGVPASRFGLLATLSFAAAVPSALASGFLVDRLEARRVLFGLFAASALGIGILATASSFAWLVVGVAVAGVAMSITNPLTNDIVARQVPSTQRGAVMGVKQSGVQMGQFLAGLVLPSVAAAAGWHAAVAATSVVVLAGALLTTRHVAAPPPGAPARGAPTSLRQLPRTVWPLVAYSFFVGAALQATNAYLPLFAFEQLSLSRTAAGMTVAAVGGVGLAARLLWGRATDRSAAPDLLLVLLAGGGTTACALLAVSAATGTRVLLWIAACLTGATVVPANVVVMTAVVRLLGGRSVGGASGVLSVGLYAGFAVGPASFGALLGARGYPTAWSVTAAVDVLAVLVAAGTAVAARQARRSRVAAVPASTAATSAGLSSAASTTAPAGDSPMGKG